MYFVLCITQSQINIETLVTFTTQREWVTKSLCDFIASITAERGVHLANRGKPKAAKCSPAHCYSPLVLFK